MHQKYSHWFFINSITLSVFTYGLGDHPSTTYHFQNEVDFNRKIEKFKNDGYEFIKDQAK